MLAAAASGHSLALFNRDYKPEQVAALSSSIGVDLLVSEQPLRADTSCRQFTLDDLFRALPPMAAQSRAFPETDAELLMLTSGTTDEPKFSLN